MWQRERYCENISKISCAIHINGLFDQNFLTKLGTLTRKLKTNKHVRVALMTCTSKPVFLVIFFL